jgi:Zn-dependent protease
MPVTHAVASPERVSRGSIRVFDVLVGIAATGATFVWSAGIVPSVSGSSRMSDADAIWVWASLIGLGIGAVPHVVAHELGHLLAARALRLRVVSVRVGPLRFGRPDQSVAGTGGHVRVDLAHARRWVPMRMGLLALAGPAANVAVAMATATTVIANRSVSTGLRTQAVGVTVAGLCLAIGNLAPRRLTGDHETDGRTALRWIFRPADARARVAVKAGSTRQRVIPPPSVATTRQRREFLLSTTADGSPEIAVAAMTELLRRRPRWDDGWQDFEVVERFAARPDLPADVRAQVAGQYALSLALAHVVSLGPSGPTAPDSPEVRRMTQLAELALAADPQALPARTALGLVRVVQHRAAEARTVLVDVPTNASPVARARACAVLGIAETELGDLDQARELAALARRNAPDDSVVKLLETFLTSKARR